MNRIFDSISSRVRAESGDPVKVVQRPASNSLHMLVDSMSRCHCW